MSWNKHETCIYRIGPKCVQNANLACFDFDGTLALSSKGETYASKDYVYAYENTIEKLREYNSKGFTIIVFSNRKGAPWMHNAAKSKMDKLISDSGFNMWIFLAIGGKKDDLYRKPNTGMMTLFKHLSGLKTFGKDTFYCGDSSGPSSKCLWFRWGEADSLFAKNNEISFYEPNQVFKEFDIHDVDKDTKLIIVIGQYYSGWDGNIPEVGNVKDLNDGRSLIILSHELILSNSIPKPIKGTTPVYYVLGYHPTHAIRTNIINYFGLNMEQTDMYLYFRGSHIKSAECKDYIKTFQMPIKYYRCN